MHRHIQPVVTKVLLIQDHGIVSRGVAAVIRSGVNYKSKTTGDIYVGANSGTLYRSTDGRNWTLPHRAAGDINWRFSRLATGPVLKASR